MTTLSNITVGVGSPAESTYSIVLNQTTTDSYIIVNNGSGGAVIISDLHKFSRWYENVHGYLGAIVSIFGLIANLLNIIVLTRKHMISSTNYILIALAVADMLKMVSYLPYSIYMYIIANPTPLYGHSRNWVTFVLIHNSFVITCHTVAMWLTVSLAVFRYIVVCHHTLGPRFCNLYRAKFTIVAITVTTILFCTPQYAMMEVREVSDGSGDYWMAFRNISHIETLQTMSFWTYGVVIKLVPCILLSVLSALLIHAMYKANKKREKLKSQGKRAESERTSEHNRTTAMLVAVVLCFVITEAPQGILMFLSGIYTDVFERIYTPLGDVMDILVLINSAVNFILYCIMSRQFRDTFSDIFLQPCRRKVRNAHNGLQYSSINQTGRQTGKTSQTRV